MDLAKKIKEMTNSKSEIRLIPYDQAYAPGFEDMERRIPSIDKITKLLGWKIEKDLTAILMDVIEYESGLT
jgi:UDP-glucose 4-epimerase